MRKDREVKTWLPPTSRLNLIVDSNLHFIELKLANFARPSVEYTFQLKPLMLLGQASRAFAGCGRTARLARAPLRLATASQLLPRRLQSTSPSGLLSERPNSSQLTHRRRRTPQHPRQRLQARCMDQHSPLYPRQSRPQPPHAARTPTIHPAPNHRIPL